MITFIFADGMFNKRCGINGNLEYFEYPLVLYSLERGYKIQSILVLGLIPGVCWDWITFLLYFCKIYSFRGYKDTETIVFKRIISTLYKIFILTLLYEVMFILLFFPCFPSMAMSYSIYLMMDHNKEKYLKFLRWTSYLKLHWICCCWRHIVIDQLNEVGQEMHFDGTVDEMTVNSTLDASVPERPRVMTVLSVVSNDN